MGKWALGKTLMEPDRLKGADFLSQCRQPDHGLEEANFSRLQHTTAPILPQHTLEAATADLAACKYPPRIMHSIDTTPHAAARRDSAARTRAPQRLRLSGTQPSNMWRCARPSLGGDEPAYYRSEILL